MSFFMPGEPIKNPDGLTAKVDQIVRNHGVEVVFYTLDEAHPDLPHHGSFVLDENALLWEHAINEPIQISQDQVESYLKKSNATLWGRSFTIKSEDGYENAVKWILNELERMSNEKPG